MRQATADDLDAIWAIESSVFGVDAWSREMMREELAADHRYYLALVCDQDAIAGDGSEAAGEPADAERLLGYGGLLVVGLEGDIQTIALAPEARGAGHGKRLMEALLAAAAERGVHAVFLEVRADNPVARGLYASLGFVEIGVRPRYYQPDGVDAIVMRVGMGDLR